MKNKKHSKIISVILSVLILASVIVPGTALTVLAEESFPAPILSQSPQLLKEFATTDVSIPTVAFSENYTPSFAGSVEAGAPIIATVTEQAAPNDSISIYGTSFSEATVYAYGLIDGKGIIKQLSVISQRDDFINAVIETNFDYSMYIVWVKGSDGKISAPVRVNAPKLTWTSATKASSGAELRIYGKFLTTNNGDGENAKSNVFLTDGSTYYTATVTEATPYRVTITLPTALANGDYKVFVHNGHGGDYGWSNSLSIEIDSNANNFWQTDSSYTKTVTVTNGYATDDDIKNAINSASAGGTIYFPAGTYVIRDKITVAKSLRFVGASKDSVKIVAVFAQTQSSNDALGYGDLNVNTSCTAAFEVNATPCEFYNLTFMDYVSGSTRYNGITAPTNYNIDYAHGMFIKANNTTDTGESGLFKIDNCNFKIQRTHSDAKGCIYLNATKQEEYHTQFESKYDFYSRSAYASSPLWIETDHSEITNCYFETPKEIFTRNMHGGYIHGNEFVGTWVIAGNSGPSAIHDNNTQNIDISNNRIYGLDEITDPDGHVVTGDQTYARTIVFQKSLGVSKNQYIMNNVASRVGELNYNSGEHILFEEVAVTYIGDATLSNNNMTLKLKDMPIEKWTSDNRFTGYFTTDGGAIKLGHTRTVTGQVVIISKGRGVGQWRTVQSVSADRTITIDRPWDVDPDQNSIFVVAPGFITPVVYKNTIEGPKLYYNNYNSTNGVNAYSTMVGTVIDRNHFSQMQAGIAINPQYNMKSYTYNGTTTKVDYNFIMYSDMLVMNNTINNTRYGIWNFPSITLSGMDASDEEAPVNLQIGSIIRNNNISNQRRLVMGAADTNAAVDYNVYMRGGVSVVVGRDYWNSSQVLSTRYWMNDVVVENNNLINPENGYIDVTYSQNNTILRNNTCEGNTNINDVLVAHNPTSHNSGKTIVSPIYIPATQDTDILGGTYQDGMVQDDTLSPSIKITNETFADGLKYWSSADGTQLASLNASVMHGTATISKGIGNGIKSSAFKYAAEDISVINEENKVAFIVKYSGSSDFNVKLYVNGVAKNNATADVYSDGNLKLCYYPNVYWNTSDTYHLAITSNSNESAVSILYVHVARCRTNNLLLDLVNYRPYNYRYGELTEGEDINNVKTPVFYNNDFSSGLDYWRTISGDVTENGGTATLNSAKLQSVHFLPSALKDGDTIAVCYKLKSVDSSLKISLSKKTVQQFSSADSRIWNIETTLTETSDMIGITSTATYTQAENTYSYLSVILEGSAEIEYISVVKIEGSGVNLVYTDVATGKRYLSDMRDPDGTAETGFEKLGRKYQNNETYAVNETFMNGDFSEGLKYWSVAINSSGYASKDARVDDGVLTLTPSANGGKGISSAHFKIPNAEIGKKVRITYDYYHIIGTNTSEAYYQYSKVAVYKGASHQEIKSSLNTANGGAWQTKYTEITISDPDDYYVISFEVFDQTTVCKLRDIRLVYVD